MNINTPKAECPACGHKQLAHNNSEVDCENCDTNYVFEDEETMSMWD